MSDFEPFPKISRLSREMIVTEKIDGTNAQVLIVDHEGEPTYPHCVATVDGLALYAGSRNRWITPDDDNFGFAAWVRDEAKQLALLGPGRHFGEWWGSGIQRGYGLPKGEKRWSLFNTTRWHTYGEAPREFVSLDPRQPTKVTTETPPCVGVVPVLYRGEFSTERAIDCLSDMECYGSYAAPGFTKPEGIVVFHVAGNVAFKKTLDRDGLPKGTIR